MSGPIIIVLSAGGLHLARRLAGNLDQAVVHGLAGRVDDADETFTDTLAHLRQAFKDGRAIIGICAAGILIRALAPVIKDKCAEPPVLAVAEDGSTVVPLLGGHNGANQLAGELADALGVSAAITTASDVKLGMALDDPPPGWKVGNRAAAKPVVAALLAGEPVGQRQTFDMIADDVDRVVFTTHLVNADDVGMLELGRGSGLAKELLGFRRVELPLAGNLDGHRAVEFFVPRLPDRAKRPGTHLLDEVKVADGLFS